MFMLEKLLVAFAIAGTILYMIFHDYFLLCSIYIFLNFLSFYMHFINYGDTKLMARGLIIGFGVPIALRFHIFQDNSFLDLLFLLGFYTLVLYILRIKPVKRITTKFLTINKKYL